MKSDNRIFQQLPVDIVGSTHFGRYPKISVEMTINMIISDGWLVPFAGYAKRLSIHNAGQGRGIFASDKLNKMFLAIDGAAYYVTPDLTLHFIGNFATLVGDVYIQANNANQVAFSDGTDIWIYTDGAVAPVIPWQKSKSLPTGVLDFKPGYLAFQNGRFISPDLLSNTWRLSRLNNGLDFPSNIVTNEQYIGKLQTKTDNTQAAVRVPSKGNQLFVFGKTVTESWFDVGYQLFPYQRSTNSNIDYGCANPNSIAYLDNYVVWLGKNEQAGYAIMVADGSSTTQLSTDGINFLLAHLKNPENVYGFLFKQDGHVIYLITWPDDNLSYIYDFDSKAFFNVTNPDLNAHIAKRVAFFNGRYYFISFIDGNLYELSSELYTGDGHDLPRIRVGKNIRLPDQSRFVLSNFGFTIEQGAIPFNDINTTFELGTEDRNIIGTENHYALGGGYNYNTYQPRFDLTLSKDGGENFGSAFPKLYYPYGRRQNRLWWLNLGSGNDIVWQVRFYGNGRWLATNGVANIYQ